MARLFWQPDRYIDCDDRRRLGRGDDLGKARHDAQAQFATLRAHERNDPTRPATVDPREPCLAQGFAHPSKSGIAAIHSIG